MEEKASLGPIVQNATGQDVKSKRTAFSVHIAPMRSAANSSNEVRLDMALRLYAGRGSKRLSNRGRFRLVLAGSGRLTANMNAASAGSRRLREYAKQAIRADG